MFGIFLDFFANPISWVFIGLFMFVGLLIGIFLRPWAGNQVIKFIPSDHRFIDLGIDEETAISIQCKKVKGMPIQRFLKYSPGYTGVVGRILKKPITRHLGIEGTAYTWKIKSGRWIKAGSLEDSVKTLWGAEAYDAVPDPLKKQLEESRIQVTVDLDEAPLTPAGMRTISEEDIKSEEDRQAAKVFWDENKSAQRGYYVNLILAAGTGFAVCAGLVLIGIIKSPGDTTPIAPQAVLLGSMLKGLLRI